MNTLAGYGSTLRLGCGICGATFEGAVVGPSERGKLLDTWNQAHAGCRVIAQDAALALTARGEDES